MQARKTAKAEKGAVAANYRAWRGGGHREPRARTPWPAEAWSRLRRRWARQEPASLDRVRLEPTRLRRAQTATAQAPEMNAMTPAAADTNHRSGSRREIRRVLALPPQQRVLRLQQMQPEDFESFIKSLRPVQRQALVAGMSPDLKEAVGALENPEQTTAQELFAERLTRDIYANAQLAGSDDRFLAQSLQHLSAQERADALLPGELRARRDPAAGAGQV